MLRPHSSRTRLAQHCTAALRPNGLLPQTYYARHAFSTKDSNVKSVAVLGELLLLLLLTRPPALNG